MLRAAYDSTKDAQYLILQRKAFDWFLGANDLHIPLYDTRTRGCYDALSPGGINTNQGAEGTLGFLMSLLEVIDSLALLEKYPNEEDSVPADSHTSPSIKPRASEVEIKPKEPHHPKPKMQELT
jgi:hypothetical protein